jgi:putative N6-adenine-specific DNA methylase
MTVLTLVATTAMGVEAVVTRELRALGYEAKAGNGYVRFAAVPADIPRANLWLRSAERVKVLAGEFSARTFDELFEGTKALPWEDWIPRGGEFPVAGRSHASTLHSVPACQSIVKKAIVERLRAAYGYAGPMVPEDGPTFQIEVALHKDHATLSLDTSGDALHRRGYRAKAGESPIKETLAATLLQLTFWRADRPFADPFCGSGTIAIEAALLGRDIAPGLRRSFASQAWPWIGDQAWERAYEEADDRAKRDLPLDIAGSDRDPEMIEIALENARLAGLEAKRGGKHGDREGGRTGLRFKQMEARDLRPWADFGVIVTNPPWGERVGEQEEIRALWGVLGHQWRSWETWSVFVISALEGFEAAYGAKAGRRRKLYNGRIPAQYYQYASKRRPGS